MSKDDRVAVRNPADPRQVRRAARQERDRELRRLQALLAVMQTPHGRLVMWGLLERAGIYQSVFDREAAYAAYKAGRQDFGHELLAELVSLDEGLYQLMESEARERARLEATSNQAAHTASAKATTEQTDGDSSGG